MEPFSLPAINSLVRSHLRLGYAPPPGLLHCLAPQIRRLLPASSGGDAARLLQLLAAVPYSPGPAVVGLLLGRVLDEEAAAAAEQGAAAGGGSDVVAAARQAADRLLSL